jgi:uroporphyrin-III C-methyltransferase
MTVRGMELLSRADVIVYDRLVDVSLLARARPDAECVYVGKSAGKHSLPQAEINALLVEHGRRGRLVARVKGGDPFVFGRGGEEALALAEAGVPFEVVPGVSSAIAVPAYAGIPVTHRGLSTSVTIVTGHEDETGQSSGVDWPAIAMQNGTLVFLMGVSNLPTIVKELIENGRGPDTPAAIIEKGTMPEQRVVSGTLGDICLLAGAAHIQPPAITVVGDVVSLGQQLAGWSADRINQLAAERAAER